MKKLNWKSLTTGQLSRNKYWGESNDQAYRSVLATSTVIWGNDLVILVDPAEAIEKAGEKLRELDLSPEKVDIIISTHYHGDHHVDADKYPNAVCYMSNVLMEDFEAAVRENRIPEQYSRGIVGVFKPIDPKTALIPNVELVSLPGHTCGDMGVLFQAEEGRVLAGGDTIITVEFFANCDGFWINDSMDATRESIKKAANIADWIIPGHGAPFKVSDIERIGNW